jgi:hypothetical protein
MSFLSRVLFVIGLSIVMTAVLMVIHWEPERPVARTAVEMPPPAPIAASAEPAIEQAAAVQTATAESVYGEERIDWVMQDAQEIEELPTGVRSALAGCVIPRAPEFPNVISAALKQVGQTDLAVLCVRGPRAAVHVFWGGNPAGAEVATDFDFIPGTYIRTALAADIGVEVRRELPIEPGMPLRIHHDGIQLGNGCCSTTHYWHRGRWRSYVSGD